MLYAIEINLDNIMLFDIYAPETRDIGLAYSSIVDTLYPLGFTRLSGNIFVGNDSMNAVDCVLAIQELHKRLHWFSASVHSARLLRIDSIEDLLPALGFKQKNQRR